MDFNQLTLKSQEAVGAAAVQGGAQQPRAAKDGELVFERARAAELAAA